MHLWPRPKQSQVITIETKMDSLHMVKINGSLTLRRHGYLFALWTTVSQAIKLNFGQSSFTNSDFWRFRWNNIANSLYTCTLHAACQKFMWVFLISRISQIFNHSRKYFNENFALYGISDYLVLMYVAMWLLRFLVYNKPQLPTSTCKSAITHRYCLQLFSYNNQWAISPSIKAAGLDVIAKSPTVQDACWPIPGLISYAVVIERWELLSLA